MKTTIETSDDLAKQAKTYAASQNITMRALIEQALRQVLRKRRPVVNFQLRDASVDGQGLQDEFRNATWADIQKAAYEGRGG